ncbi:YjgN family protein [Geomesophilobacter sediminis]|uniref:DUF898 domain-containing protein n=1 Tax=Geomesophilobacter sediminis TaxID=2798584 RepID=A0A8J7SAB5_9BACT|nr:YjgN family protein [Geomesophilobacter sediminis]MBJ6727375.1 DUF898 domain-containing protein [Geomesophilobacter sediminis]
MALVYIICPHCRNELLVDGDEHVCGRCSSRIVLKKGQYSHYFPGNTPKIDPGPMEAGSGPEPAPGCAVSDVPENGAPGGSLPTPPAQPRCRESFSFRFTATAKEYFGIWIVNTLLRIVSLGFYSPWAKVRRRRYFYANTLLDGAPFDYLADPLAILKGWLIAGAFVVVYSVCNRSYPAVAPFVAMFFSGVYPWILVRSRMFNCFNSTYRNIRFRFTPDYKGAYREFLWMPLLAIPTLGLIIPYLLWRQKRFLVENTHFGAASFSFDATPRAFYRLLAPVLAVVPVMIGSLVWIGLAAKGGKPLAHPALALVPVGTFFLAYFLILVYVPTVMANVVWSGTSIGGLRFSLNLKVREVTWIYLSNIVSVVFTLGLLAPWAAVRMARYRFERFTVSGIGGLDSVSAGERQEVGAAGEEIGDLLGFDFGL